MKRRGFKMKNVKLAATLGACALVGVVGIGSTFAYLTANTNEVKNTFTVGHVHINKDELGSGLLESKVVDKDGNYVGDQDGENVETVVENDYKNLTANQELIKDPTLQGLTDDSVDAYVFIKVSGINNDSFSAINAVKNDKKTNLKNVKVGDKFSTNNADWTVVAKDDNTVTLGTTREGAAKINKATAFNEVVVANVDEKAEFKDITAVACAIQKAGFADMNAALKEAKFQ
jgi:predicted ribosomally synthesized peptide with SipW-like signal peptide